MNHDLAADPKQIDHRSEISALLSVGLINTYQAGYLTRMNKSALSDADWDEALKDAKTATQAGVDNDRDQHLMFWIDQFADRLGRAKGLAVDKVEQLKKAVWAQKDTRSFETGEDFKEAAKEWLDGLEVAKLKTAYKNVSTRYPSLKKYDLREWAELVKRIDESVRLGWRRPDAVVEAASELADSEKLDFMHWYKLHTSGEDSKYGVGGRIKQQNAQSGNKNPPTVLDQLVRVYSKERPMEMTKLAEFSDEQFYYLPKSREQQEELRQVRPPPRPPYGAKPAYQAASGMLAEPNLIQVQRETAQQAAQQKQEQNAVDFESARGKLIGRVFAIDKLLEKYKRVLHQDEVDGIQDSLHDLKKKIRKLKMAALMKDTLLKTAGIWEENRFDEGADLLRIWAADEQLERGEQALAPGAPPEVQGLEQKPPAQNNIFTEQKKNLKLKEVVGLLYNVSVILKNRNIVRDLAEIDILLDDLKMASFFPEIQDAQAKLIDAFGYASNKIEDVLPKLRGGLVLDEAEDKPVKTHDQSVNELHELARQMDQPKPAPEEPVEEEPEDDTLKQLLLPPR